MPAPGFYRSFRIGNHLAVPTFVNEAKETSLFLINSGAAANLMDTKTAEASAKTYRDELTIVKGIQGKVNQTSRADRVSLVFAGFRQDNPSLITISLEKMGDSMGSGKSTGNMGLERHPQRHGRYLRVHHVVQQPFGFHSLLGITFPMQFHSAEKP